MIAQFIQFLVNSGGARLEDIHAIGHSLGGHTVGNVGKHIQRLFGRKLPRIVALDPAGLYFENTLYQDVFNPSDADYTEVIHSNAGGSGYLKPIGDVDFYPNGGSVQVGCGIDPLTVCSHQRSVEYFVESINSPKGFLGRRCSTFLSVTAVGCLYLDEYRYLGLENNPGSGIYWVRTASEEPFALG